MGDLKSPQPRLYSQPDGWAGSGLLLRKLLFLELPLQFVTRPNG